MAGAWLIFFEDDEVKDEVFSGEGAEDAARYRLEQCKMNWACHLFQEVDDGNEFSYSWMRMKLDADSNWQKKGGLYWHWKHGHKNIKEAFELLINT